MEWSNKCLKDFSVVIFIETSGSCVRMGERKMFKFLYISIANPVIRIPNEE